MDQTLHVENEVYFTNEMADDKCTILSQGILVLILFVLALVGNGLILVAYCRDHRMHTATNMLVISHISAEFAFAVNGILIYGSSLIRLKVVDGNLCILAGTVNMFLFFVSVLSLAAISVDRYYAVVKRSHHRFTKKFVLRAVITFWTQAALSAVPWDLILINKPGKRFIAWVLGNCEKYLTLRNDDNVPVITFRIILWTVSFFIPCCIIFYSTVRILRSALQNRTRVQVFEYPRTVDAYSKSAYTTIIIIMVYFLCLIPSMVFYIFREKSSKYYSRSLHIIAKVAMAFRSVCYPVIFIARNRKFSGYVRSFVVKKFRLLQWVNEERAFCRPPESGIRTNYSVYFCSPSGSHNAAACVVTKSSERQTTLFRGTPIKLAFTDLGQENHSEGLE
ncbi:C-X-C chemokine receptor type 2-like [Montipora foliosa]|uniref:C-X-C chemokine receptor type 2-like n=1 Tax=Montipora foliosa TaxID=591990 RepID=UPI0035F11C64